MEWSNNDVIGNEVLESIKRGRISLEWRIAYNSSKEAYNSSIEAFNSSIRAYNSSTASF